MTGLLPTAPAPPAASAGGSLLPLAPAAADPAIADFVAELTAALKGVTEPSSAGAEPAPKTADVDADELPQVLAMLGLVVLPPPLQAPTGIPVGAPTTDAAGPVLASTRPAPQLLQPRGAAQTEAPPQTPDSEPGPLDELATAATATATATVAQSGVRHAALPTQHGAGPSPAAVSADALVQAQSHPDLSSQKDSAGESERHSSGQADDQTFAAAVAQTSTTASPAAQPSAMHPSEVVSQIVHQAELYRLPGNRGVRIQLHPEDLGGVQVTLRYAAGGGLELHINVEHAATGALVQAGWTELRDALATQGISPDRLMMSVTGPSNANQPEFSSNGGGTSRSDSGLAQYGQGGQSERQRHEGSEDQRPSGTWNGRFEPDSSAAESPRAAAAASRIDYRV
jgi:flagellar hook-length control protein FliK